MNIAEPIILAILAAVICFAGYRLKRLAFSLLWFVIGFDLATMAMPWIAPRLSILDPRLIEVLPLAIGLLCALIGVSIERVAIATVAFGAAMLFYFSAINIGFLQFSLFGLGLAVIFGCIFTVIALNMSKPALIILTALIGAQQLTSIIVHYLPEAIPAQISTGVLILIFAVAGAIVQFKTTRHLD